jgi:hypothetical protein
MAHAWRIRWLDWQPRAENISGSPEIELTKLTKCDSVSFVSCIPANLRNISIPQPEFWKDLETCRESFRHWLDFACVRRPRDFGGLNCLYHSFCEWQAERREWQPDHASFEQLLAVHSYVVGRIRGVQLVAGLMLKEDASKYLL